MTHPNALRATVDPAIRNREIERYADRVLVLADGELLFTGTPDELRGASAHFAAAFAGFLRDQGH